MNDRKRDEQIRPLENSYVSPGVHESNAENRSAIYLSLAIVVLILLVIAVGRTGA